MVNVVGSNFWCMNGWWIKVVWIGELKICIYPPTCTEGSFGVFEVFWFWSIKVDENFRVQKKMDVFVVWKIYKNGSIYM